MMLDTTFLIDLMKGKKFAVEKMQMLSTSGAPVTISTVSIFELFSGLSQCSKPALEYYKIHNVLHQQSCWPLDDSAAERAGRIHGELVKRGEAIEAIDAMIAGIALAHNEPILTRNIKHFSRIDGLKVESY